jgi:hypothetical protein
MRSLQAFSPDEIRVRFSTTGTKADVVWKMIESLSQRSVANNESSTSRAKGTKRLKVCMPAAVAAHLGSTSRKTLES